MIGQRITITDAKNKSLIGKRGTVVDETKHTLTVQEQTNDRITIIKDQVKSITIEEHHG